MAGATMESELFAEIERPAFSVRLNVVSGYKQFLRALTASPEVQTLLEQIQTPENDRGLILRVESLVNSPSDPKFEHPKDAAVAAYLWVLTMTDPSSAELIASLILESPGFWWAQKMACKVLDVGHAKTETGKTTQESTGPSAVETKAADTSESSAVYFGREAVAQSSVAGRERTATVRKYATYNLAAASRQQGQKNSGSGNKKAVPV
jgi:hypothetical protein